MVFNKAGRKSKVKLTYNGQTLSTVQSFTYLGIDISASGSFSAGIHSLITKAKKTMMPLFRTIIKFGLPFHHNLKFFTTLIEPILLYNAENWACMSEKEIEKCKVDHNRIYEKSIKSPTTVAQLKFLKFALGVNKHCPTMAVLGETADVPLILKGYHRMLTYWNRTREMDDNTLVKKAYLENVNSNSNWCKTIQILNSSQNLHTRDISEAEFPRISRRRIRDNFIEYWKNCVTDPTRQSKLSAVYSKVKQDFQIDQYLELPSFHNNSPTDISAFLRSAFHLRDQLVNYHVSKLSLCGMKMVISRGTGTGERRGKLSTKLQATSLGNGKIRISRKCHRPSPYSHPLPQDSEPG